MKRVLVVDNDPKLQKDLSELNTDWEFSFITEGKKALQSLAEQDTSVIVSAMDLPDMKTAELLEHVKKSHPGMARIIMAAEDKLPELLHSSNIAHQFLAKPCDAGTLLSFITRTDRISRLLNNPVMVDIAGDTGSLPGLPQLYLALTWEMNKGDASSLHAIADIVNKDMSMSAKLLQLANSSYFSLNRRVETAQQAVMILGAEVIRMIALVDTASSNFDAAKNVLDMTELWEHSFAVGKAAQALAKNEKASKMMQSQSYQAGVLHDIGKLILAAKFPDECRHAFRLAAEEGIALGEAEQQIFGCNHAQVGAYLLGLWGLPDEIVEAVAYHHMPVHSQMANGIFSPLVAVYAADLCLRQSGISSGVTPEMTSQDTLITIDLGSKSKQWMDVVAACSNPDPTLH